MSSDRQGRAIKGVASMKIGGKWTLPIPPPLGYVDRGAGDVGVVMAEGTTTWTT